MRKEINVTCYTPDEKLPPDGEIVMVLISGFDGAYTRYKNCITSAEFYKDEGWFIKEIDTDIEGAWVTVHAWVDYGPVLDLIVMGGIGDQSTSGVTVDPHKEGKGG